MGLDDCLFARLQRPVEVGGDDDAVGNQSGAADSQARNDRESAISARWASMIACSHDSSARSRSEATTMPSEINLALPKARSSSGLSLTRTIRAPASVAACLICAKLCVADESMPVTR